MKIMVPVTILRMVPRHGDRGTPERKEKGQKIQDTLYDWERNLPVSFMEIEAPDLIMFFDDPILRHLQPVYFGSLNVAVAMGNCIPNEANCSASFCLANQCVYIDASK